MRLRKLLKETVKTIVLTAAMAITLISFSPATSTQAKTTPRLNYTKMVLQCGQQKKLKLKGYSGKVRFSSGSKFAQVNPATGTVKALATGITTVKAKAGKRTYKCTVSVVPKRTNKYKDVKITYKLKKDKKTVETGKFNTVVFTVKNLSKETPITLSNLLTVNNGNSYYEFRISNTIDIAPGTSKTVQYTLKKGYTTTKGNSSFIALYHRKPQLVKVNHSFSKGNYSYWEQLDFVAGDDVQR